MRHEIPIWQVDAFTDRPFTGNPAAVCVLHEFPSDDWLQAVASEMNLSETAFIVAEQTQGSFHLRWFTPAAEVDLCGHATLAAAHTLIEMGRHEASKPIYFQTRSGELVCSAINDLVTLDFPATPIIQEVERSVALELCAALGLEPITVMRSQFDLLVVVADEKIVRDLQPDFARLRNLRTRGTIVTAPSDDPSYDFVSRFFAPQHNIDEDPVTGSAHCCLAPYWAGRLGKDKLVGYQASLRGGTVYCQLAGERVHLTGKAVSVLRGNLLLETL